MKNLYDKSKIKFSLIWIIIYVVGASLADALSAIIGIEKCVTVVFLLILTIILLNWLLKHNLNVEYGLCKPTQNPKYFLYYIPLVVLISVNLWFGISVNFGLLESLLYATSMPKATPTEQLCKKLLQSMMRALELDLFKDKISDMLDKFNKYYSHS